MDWLYRRSAFKSLIVELRLFGYTQLNQSDIAVHFTKAKQGLSLELSNFDLLIIPKSIFNFNDLYLLNLQNNNINYMFDEIGNLTNLKFLYLSENRLLEIPQSFEKLQNIEILDLSSNAIQELQANFDTLSHLTHLNLSRNELEKVSDIWKLRNLKVLNLAENKIVNIADDLQLDSLEELYLSENNLRSIPAQLANLKNLRIIRLESNNLHRIPDPIIMKIDQYRYFNASNNHMQSIMSNLGKHVFKEFEKRLENNFAEFYDKFPQTTDFISQDILVKIYIEFRMLGVDSPINKLVRKIMHVLPDGSLRFNFQDLPIDTFPSTLCEVPRISMLQIPLKLIKTLPTNLHHLRDLKALLCWNSHDNKHFVLEEVPSTIIRFINLEELNLWFNKVKKLPANIGNLHKLRRLNLGFNEFSTLPSSISKLEYLELLNLQGMPDLNFHINRESLKITR